MPIEQIHGEAITVMRRVSEFICLDMWRREGGERSFGYQAPTVRQHASVDQELQVASHVGGRRRHASRAVGLYDARRHIQRIVHGIRTIRSRRPITAHHMRGVIKGDDP